MSRAPHPVLRPRATMLAALAFALLAGTGGAAAADGTVPSPAPTVTPKAEVAFKLADPLLSRPGDLAPSVRHPGILWTYDGRRSRPMLFAVDEEGRTRAAYQLTGVSANGWNTIAVVRDASGRSTLVLGDIQAGGGRRNSVAIYKVPEPETLANGTLRVRAYQASYPDGGHDAESLLADPSDGRLYIVTLSADGAGVYALPTVLGQGLANQMTRLWQLNFVVRGGRFTPDGRVVLRGIGVIRVLPGVRADVAQVLKLPRQATGRAFGIVADGERVLVGGAGPWIIGLPLPREAGTTASPLPVADGTDDRITYPDGGGMPGGLLGTGSLVGVVLLLVLGVVLHLRDRRG